MRGDGMEEIFSCFCFTSRPEITFRVNNISIYSVVLLPHSVFFFIVLRGLGGRGLDEKNNCSFWSGIEILISPPRERHTNWWKYMKIGFFILISCKFQNKRKFPADPRKRPADLRADAGRSETTSR